MGVDVWGSYLAQTRAAARDGDVFQNRQNKVGGWVGKILTYSPEAYCHGLRAR